MLSTFTFPGISPLRQTKLSLSLIFLAWKALLFLIAVTSPGLGYDTSTSLLQPEVKGWIAKFVRWDAIFFVAIAQRGYLFEQEWAFGWGWTRALNFCGTLLRPLGLIEKGNVEAVAGVVISHFSHLASVIVLYELSKEVFCVSEDEKFGTIRRKATPRKELEERQSRFAFVAAALHIFSPAGMFLSAPYAEGLFSVLQFLGYYCYVRAYKARAEQWQSTHYIGIMMAGVLFAISTMVRSNGLFSGALFAYDGITNVIGVLWTRDNINRVFHILCLIPVAFASLILLIGAGLPQYLAYQEFCSDRGERRLWCDSIVPSIYAWVQSRYW
jgi:phosphatidylinositol glycan class V